MILTPLQKLPKNGDDWGKLIGAKGFKKLPKVQNIAQSGHTADKSHFKAGSHYCVSLVHLQQMVAFPQEDRNFPISALTQPTMENPDRCV